MYEYVLTTEKQGWQRVLYFEGEIKRVVFSLCPTKEIPCAVRISRGSDTKETFTEDVEAYLSVSGYSPQAEMATDAKGKFYVDLFQPGGDYTGGHLIIDGVCLTS